MSLNISSLNGSLAYMGVRAPTPPNMNVFTRVPTVGDYIGYTIGDFWIYSLGPNPQQFFVLVALGYESATWLEIASAGALGTEFVTAAGTVIPALGIINIIAGSNISTAAVAPNSNNLQINLDNNVTIPGNFVTTGGNIEATAGSFYLPFSDSAVPEGYIYFNLNPVITIPSSNNNFFGYLSGNPDTTAMAGTNNLGVGDTTLTALTTASDNTAVGSGALELVETSSYNTAVGFSALGVLVSNNSGSNTAVGWASAVALQTGIYNVAVGATSGDNWTGAESSNVILGCNFGITGESNVMRLGGGTGGGNSLQNKAFCSGVTSNVSAGRAGVMFINTATNAGGNGGVLDQMGIVTPVANAGYVLTNTGLNTTPTWQAPGGGGGGGITQLDGDAGSTVGTIITLVGGAGIATTAAGADVTINSTASFDGDTGNASPIAGVLYIKGGTNVTTSAAGGTVTINATGGGGGVTSLIATANQTAVSAATGAVTISTPAVFIAPGSVEVTNGFKVDAGVITLSPLVSAGVVMTSAAGVISSRTILPIANGGTNASATPGNNAVMYFDGTRYQGLANGTTGQVLTATTSSPPSWAPGGASPSGGMTWNNVPYPFNNPPVAGNGYITVISGYQPTLPLHPVFGDTYSFIRHAGNIIINQNAGDTIFSAHNTTTQGTGGSLNIAPAGSGLLMPSLTLVCLQAIDPYHRWYVLSSNFDTTLCTWI
jgi:hypothetical protein